MQREKEQKSTPVLLYVPVPHQGYIQFFERYRDRSQELWLIGTSLAREFPSFHTEIREVDSGVVKKMIDTLEIFKTIRVLTWKGVSRLSPPKLITAPESISQKVIAKYFPKAEVIFDGTIFLRYDEANVKVLKPVKFDRKSDDLFDRRMMALATDEAEKSADWWRHVGAVIVRGGQVITVSYNDPVLSPHMPYIFGNPRDFIEAGTLSHFSDALHSEMGAFAEFLRLGMSTAGADIYVSVFPCPDCAKLIAHSGIRRCFFGSGHASLDGEKVLRAKGVELVYVPLEPRA